MSRGATEPDCGVLELTNDTYGTEIEPHSGIPGDRVRLFGTTLRSEDGRWAPADRLEAWWNTDTSEGQPIEDGPVVELVEVRDMRVCSFESGFVVPDVEPGTYNIAIVVFHPPATASSGYFLAERFAVLDPDPAP